MTTLFTTTFDTKNFINNEGGRSASYQARYLNKKSKALNPIYFAVTSQKIKLFT